MNLRPTQTPASTDSATTPAAPTGTSDRPASDHNDRWDADEEPWRHPPVAPVDESAAKSLGRAISDAVVSAADETVDKDEPKAKP